MPTPFDRRDPLLDTASSQADTITTADVARYIKERIKRGLFVAGQRMVEIDLSRETGASRARVREALRALAAEGLITIEAFRGASVKRFDRAEVEQIYQLREVLEGLAARLAAVRGEASGKARIGTLNTEMEALQRSGDRDGYARANEAWHQAIIAAAANPHLAETLERLRLPMLRFQFQAFYQRSAMADANADHRAVTTAVLAGDGDQAEALMRQHVRGGLREIRSLGDELFA